MYPPQGRVFKKLFKGFGNKNNQIHFLILPLNVTLSKKYNHSEPQFSDVLNGDNTGTSQGM